MTDRERERYGRVRYNKFDVQSTGGTCRQATQTDRHTDKRLTVLWFKYILVANKYGAVFDTADVPVFQIISLLLKTACGTRVRTTCPRLFLQKKSDALPLHHHAALLSWEPAGMGKRGRGGETSAPPWKSL